MPHSVECDKRGVKHVMDRKTENRKREKNTARRGRSQASTSLLAALVQRMSMRTHPLYPMNLLAPVAFMSGTFDSVSSGMGQVYGIAQRSDLAEESLTLTCSCLMMSVAASACIIFFLLLR